MVSMISLISLIPLTIAAFHLLGVLSSLHAVMTNRTAQGAIAWGISLITFPYLMVPYYWIFGRAKFKGYVESWRHHQAALDGSTAPPPSTASSLDCRGPRAT